MNIQDLLMFGIPKSLAEMLVKLRQAQPFDWKGNFPPDTRHFERIDRFGIGADASSKTLWVKFTYTDAGSPHVLQASAPALEFGKRGAHCTVTVDGVEEPGQMVVSFRSGFENGFYERAVFEFYYGPEDGTHIRFDGDLA